MVYTTMKRQDDFFKTQIRIPPNVYSAVKDAAIGSGRSINAEMIELFLIGLEQKELPVTASALRTILREELDKTTL